MPEYDRFHSNDRRKSIFQENVICLLITASNRNIYMQINHTIQKHMCNQINGKASPSKHGYTRPASCQCWQVIINQISFESVIHHIVMGPAAGHLLADIRLHPGPESVTLRARNRSVLAFHNHTAANTGPVQPSINTSAGPLLSR